MPLLTVNTWPTMSRSKKRELIHRITDITVDTLEMIPDKIQVLIQEQDPENFGKAGAMASDQTFSEDSRITDWNTRSTYGTAEVPVHAMVILTIDVWDTFQQETKDEWVARLTDSVTTLTNAPGDKVLVLIREMPPGNWGQNGVTGANDEFLAKSRKL